MNLSELRRVAQRYGVTINTNAPGDGVRRFEFASAEFGLLGRALGIAQAETWLDGFMAYADKVANRMPGARNPPRDTHRSNVRPGKFDSNLDEYTHRLSLEPDETLGDVSEQGYFYAIVRNVEFPDIVRAAEDGGEDEYSARKAWLKELGSAWKQFTAIIREDSQGFVSVEYFRSESMADKKWRDLDEEIQRGE